MKNRVFSRVDNYNYFTLFRVKKQPNSTYIACHIFHPGFSHGMDLFKRGSKEAKRFSELIDMICNDLNVDKLVVLHFINNDIVRIYNNGQIEKIKLNQLEKELEKHLQTEAGIKNKINETGAQIDALVTRQNALASSLNEKVNSLNTRQKELSGLEAKLREINTKLQEAEKQKKQVEYEVIIKNHTLKSKSSPSFKKVGVALSVLTGIAILIAIFLILYKRK